MKQKIIEQIPIPQGVSCHYHNKVLTCKKGSVELVRKMDIPGILVALSDSNIELISEKGNKNQLKIIKSYAAHIRNIFHGLEEKFVYHLEAANVHFPMTFKLEKEKLTINNFLGEKNARFAVILPHVEVDIKGQQITVSSHSRDAAGQTSANIEKATKIRRRDRRIFQDGIFIVEKPGRGV